MDRASVDVGRRVRRAEGDDLGATEGRKCGGSARAELAEGVGIVQLFVRAGLAASGKDAKRLIQEGGAKVNDEIVTDTAIRYGAGHFAEPLKLTAGKKRHALVVLA